MGIGIGRRALFFLNPWLFFFLFSVFNTNLCMADDRISPGQSLTGDQTITSKDGNFVLGFFSPGKSKNYYIGIWYSLERVSTQSVVWVANRETPVPSKSSQLKISEDGNLVLIDQNNIPVWSTNSTSKGSNSTVAILRDNGNLVLVDGSNSSVWQSFDHLTHTWLPTGWLGYNKVTGVNQRLTSWRSDEDPAPGPFSLQIDSAGGSSQYILLWNGTKQYWTSGQWNGQIFSLVPEMTANYIYNFSYLSDEKGKNFSYYVYDKSIISNFVLGVSGQIQQYTWRGSTWWNLFWSQPRKQCDVYSLCGAFGKCDESDKPFCECLNGFEESSPKEWSLEDRTGGCVRRTKLRCERNISADDEEDKFQPLPNVQFPRGGISVRVRSIDDCQSACLNNCSCNAYAFDDKGCTIWRGKLMGIIYDGDNGKDVYIRLAASELPDPSSKKGKVTGAIAGAVAGTIAVLVIIILLVVRRRRRRRHPVSLQATEGSLVSFSYKDLDTVTKSFSEKLGGGGFGSVFKGILPDSSAVAVKKLQGLGQGEKQFRAEVSTIGTIQHINLIRLRGFCSEGGRRLLVYDYMPNGSLDAHLFQKSSATLDWKTRYQIALGTARGLVYLHEKCRDCIIHCDIKPENLLLDAAFCAKLADFGLAKLVGRDFSRVLTTMRGTRGYLAPEWISGTAITCKADVFSYGMMLFEIISGRRNTEQSEDGKVFFFPIWAAKKVIEGDVLSLLDNKLNGGVNVDELTRAARIACWCIQDDEDHRPSMGQVVQILEGLSEVHVPPIPRCLQIIAENQISIPSSPNTSRSNNTSLSSSRGKSTSSSSANE